jgi:hypothetical protein
MRLKINLICFQFLSTDFGLFRVKTQAGIDGEAGLGAHLGKSAACGGGRRKYLAGKGPRQMPEISSFGPKNGSPYPNAKYTFLATTDSETQLISCAQTRFNCSASL